MRKFLVWTGALLFLAVLGLSTWWAWPILFPSLPSAWLSTLAKADAALLQNRPDLARAALAETPSSLPVSGWLQWEKRVNAVATETQAWPWASSIAAVAQAQYPGNPELTAYLVWTLLKAGKPREASAVAAKVLPGTRWRGLAVQAAVESEDLTGGDWSELSRTLSVPSEGSFRLYQRLTALDPEPLLRKNALVTALSLGRLDDARAHLGVLTPEQRDQPPFDRLQGLVAYDQGDWARAATLLKALTPRRPETLMVLADVFLHLGDHEQARLIYDQMLADDPEQVSEALLVNRATLALEMGEPGKVVQLLTRVPEATTSAQGDRTRLLLLEARFQLGESSSVLGALDDILDAEAESPLALEAELLKGRLFPEWTSKPRLSSLLHRHPTYSPLAERLAWILLVEQDYQGALRVLDVHEAALRSQGEEVPWWCRILRAVVLTTEGRWDEASASFERVPPAWRDATFFANWSLVSYARSQQAPVEARKPLLDGALENLTKALEMLGSGTSTEDLRRRSLWLTRKGELEVALVPLQIPARRGTLRSAAAEDFRQAVQLDPENLRASFLLRQVTANQDTP